MSRIIAKEEGHDWYAPTSELIPKRVLCPKTQCVYAVGISECGQWYILLGRSTNIRLEAVVFARLLQRGLLRRLK